MDGGEDSVLPTQGCASNTGVGNSIPDWGTKIPCATWHSREEESVWNVGLFLVTGASSNTQKL